MSIQETLISNYTLHGIQMILTLEYENKLKNFLRKNQDEKNIWEHNGLLETTQPDLPKMHIQDYLQ